MQTLHRNANISRLALIVAGRRVVQPFLARALRVSLPSRAEPIPDVSHPLTPPPAAHTSDVTSFPESSIPKQPKKSKTPPSKPKGKKPSPVTRKSKSMQIVTRDSKRQKSVRKTKTKHHVPQARVLDGSGFITDGWGKDGASLYGHLNVT